MEHREKAICEENSRILEYLQNQTDLNLNVIDRSSPGKGWKGKKVGVGIARKVVLDEICERADNEDVIISMDADTIFNKGYVKSIVQTIKRNPKKVAVAVPYYHPLSGDEQQDRIMLRYEIYMRYYALNLWRIQSPFSFTALGSAIALTVKAYKAVGGLTPHLSGEDFYFLQKLRKYGKIICWNSEKVYPANRFLIECFLERVLQ